MTYQVLARKWRPQGFAALIGQDSVKTALQNALEEGRVAQAYLFSGIRGVGKTTAARLFAKALNCERGPASEPCNECPTCEQITAGSDLDVIEVDAATYSKVEQIRELTESLRYGPARDRFKVVVIDEIHRLSRQAFDALLKIVEEPPAHLTFIFATTESESVPATILSRCQEHRFRRVSAGVLAAYLREISEAEKIEVGERALRLIARAGEGSVRDSVALLDQLATFGGGKIGDRDAVRLLGGLDAGLFQRVLGFMLGGDAAAVSGVVTEIEDNGWDPKSAFTQFLAYCRDALHLALGADRAQIDLPPDDIESLAKLAKDSGYENVLRLLNQLLSSEQIVRKSEASSLALEIAWLRAAELPKLQRLEELLGAGPTGSTEAATATPSRSSTGSSSNRKKTSPARSSQQKRNSRAVEPPATATEQRDDSPDAAASGSIEGFLDLIRRSKPSLRAHLDPAALSFQGRTLSIAAAPKDPLLRDALERNREVVDQAIATTWGPEARFRVVEAKVGAPAKTKPSSTQAKTSPPAKRSQQAKTAPQAQTSQQAKQEDAQPPAKVQGRAEAHRASRAATGPPARANAAQLAEAAKHPTVQAVLDIFGGTIQSVEPRPREAEPGARKAEPGAEPSSQSKAPDGGSPIEAPKRPDNPVQRS